MAPTRKIIRRRINADGIDIECDQGGGTKHLDIKETKKIIFHRGRGPAYQKTIYTFRPEPVDNPDRTYIDPPLRVKKRTNEDLYIDYQKGVIKKIWVRAGKGPHYIRTRLTFDNTESNENRTVRIQRVYQTEEATSGDYIEVERIEKFKLFGGRGPAFQGKRVHLLNTPEQNIKDMDGPCKLPAAEE